MKIAIMQPYLFPYIGYFQLIHAVSKFVIYDDVAFITRGWINRNYLLINGEKKLFTLHLNGASSNKAINEVVILGNQEKILKAVILAYSKAPYFKEVIPIIEEILLFPESNLSKYLANSITILSRLLGIQTEVLFSSNLSKDNSLKGQDKIISICESLQATEYINAIGGQSLYNENDFRNHNIELRFLKSQPIVYKQFKNAFIPWLSIIDVLMFNSVEETRLLLQKFELIKAVVDPKNVLL
ncbi:WbqC family protein [Paenibacillus tyrfis]|uniref:WbqC family protein n=1 Tax=Paenibacillus tyrfis TaxID=1501230 RepID=UPI000B58BE60|nr:WbqC family protein [Paenibacillus tyrfis]